ncbi:hypothetical protein [Candidatus Neoehrlichia procyonis]|uniref:Uncharacterized protein n=1 Tax=Candidatus Neoehrlichia procyonis str. RAC413 TaxID=1359163 RepID=A0A0F3NL40_9RICK|nr:hypothetical protein [Candidatus Neoehrlichia lotoris]KJV68750.1 hypothetical protein NLO413_0113 [Candidatus Neoehrlichia lotoris str. RAC413]
MSDVENKQEDKSISATKASSKLRNICSCISEGGGKNNIKRD